MNKKTAMVMLIILDGWGINPDDTGNAVSLGKTPCLDRLMADHPHTRLNCSGEAVGLPAGIMGNSEVGHLNIGAGRIVYQDLLRIDRSIVNRTFFDNAPINKVMDRVKTGGTALHLMGLVSDGGVHSQFTHLTALLDMAEKKGIGRVYVHAVLDGRDTPPDSGAGFVRTLAEHIDTLNSARIATICGRFYAMDRDKRWDRIEKAYRLYTMGVGSIEADPVSAVLAAYEKGETDEFVEPVIIQENGSAGPGTIKDGDGMIFFNFRADRAREITRVFTDPSFDRFERPVRPRLCGYVCMTLYDESFDLPVAFPPVHMDGILGEVVSDRGLTQLRIAETEKYAHVTYFFNGGEERPFPGEDRCLIPSPKEVATYDLKPQMSAQEVTGEVLSRIRSGKYNFIVLNFANMDMVGHTGNLKAAICAVETVDRCVADIMAEIKNRGHVAMITADHGNAEKMTDNGKPYTAHTTNRVPFVLVDPGRPNVRLKSGKLGDIAPTILEIMSIEQPTEMTGESLIVNSKPYGTITDFITGNPVPDVGAEGNRQAVERLLVRDKGFEKSDIAVNVPIVLDIDGETYRSRVDLLVGVDGRPVMVFKCAAGSLGSCEREIVAAARLLDKNRQVPLAVVSDGKTAIVQDTVSGKKKGEGLSAIPDRDSARKIIGAHTPDPLPEKRRGIEKRLFRTYDMENVNVVK